MCGVMCLPQYRGLLYRGYKMAQATKQQTKAQPTGTVQANTAAPVNGLTALVQQAVANVTATPQPVAAYPKGKPGQSTIAPQAFNSFTAHFGAGKGHGQTVNGATMLQRTNKPARNGASANGQSAWQAINAMAPGSTATAASLLGNDPMQPYGAKGQAMHLQFACNNGYLVPAQA